MYAVFKKSKQLVVSFILFSLSATAFAQTTKVDALLNQLNKNDPDTTQIKVMRKLSAAYSSVDPSKKRYYAYQYLLLGEKNGIDSVVASAYLDIGIYYGLISKLDSAVYFFKLGQQKSKACNYEIGLARSYANIGYAYDKLERKQEAVQNYEQSLKLYRKLNIQKSINQNITNLGSLYFDLGEFKIADGYFRQVLENVKTTPNDQMGLANALFSLGGSNRKLGNQKKSLDYYQQSLAIRETIGDLNGIALSNWGIGLVHSNNKAYEKALPHLEIALKNNILLKNIDHEAMVHVAIAWAQLGLKNYQAAETAANLAVARAKQSGVKGGLSDALRVLTKVKAEQQKFGEALKLQAEYIAVNKSINKADAKKDVITSDIQRVNSENKNLEKNNKKITRQNNDYLTAIFFTTISLIVLTALLILYYNRNSKKAAINLLLHKQKQEIANANEELIVQMDIVAAQNIELEKLNSVKTKFFSIVSHDLRGPLITLKSLLEMYRQEELTATELNELLTKVEKTTSNTITFLDSLLEWSKSQLEGMVVKPSLFEIAKTAADNMKLMESQIELKALEVKNNILPELLVFADPNMINTVFRNLLSNAIKFCNVGDEIIFAAEEQNGNVQLTICDTGQGMNDTEKASLFNFTHNLTTGTAGEKGFHIGLILCKDMILRNKGTIQVDSNLGKGTTFTITLPKEKL